MSSSQLQPAEGALGDAAGSEVTASVILVAAHQQTEIQEHPHTIDSFSVILFNVLLLLCFHIFCVMLCLYSQMFLWFQQVCVKFIERKK